MPKALPLLPITLRGHHLLCFLNYSGNGYTPQFVANFNELCARLSAGEPARLTWQPDSICHPMLGHPSCHCHQPRIRVRDFLGFLSTSLTLRRWCFPPRILTFSAADVQRLRGAFRLGATRAACVGCEWFGHCSQTAKSGWPQSKLRPRQ
jgi:hypothetical protein